MKVWWVKPNFAVSSLQMNFVCSLLMATLLPRDRRSCVGRPIIWFAIPASQTQGGTVAEISVVKGDPEVTRFYMRLIKPGMRSNIPGGYRMANQQIPGGSQPWTVSISTKEAVLAGKFSITKEYHVQPTVDVMVYSIERPKGRRVDVFSTPASRCLPSGSRILAIYFRRQSEILDLSDALWRRRQGTDIPIGLLNLLNQIEVVLGARGVHI